MPVEISASDLTDPPQKEFDSFDLTDVSETVQQEAKPLRYLAGGALKTATMFPNFLGMIGSAGETAYNAVTSDKPITIDNLGEQYKEASKSGFDATLNKAGDTATKYMADAIGIDPVATNTVNQIADLVGSFVLPTPAGKGRALEQAFTFLAPTVRLGPKGNRLNKDFAVRAGTQLGVGTGLDQGIRSLMDNPDVPLMFSDKALNGTTYVPSSQLIDPVDSPTQVQASQLMPPIDNDIGRPDPALVAADKAQQEATDDQLWTKIGITAAVIASGIAGARYVSKWNKKRLPEQPFGIEPEVPSSSLQDAKDIIGAVPQGASKFDTVKQKAKVAKQLFINRAKITYGNQADSDHLMVQLARAKGATEDNIKQLRGQNNVEAAGQINAQINHGIRSDGTVDKIPMRSIAQRYQRWDTERQGKFLRYVASVAEDMQRTKAVAKDFTTKLTDEKFASLNKGDKRASKAVRDLSKGFKSNYDIFTGQQITPKLYTFGQLEKGIVQYAQLIGDVRGTASRPKIGLFDNNNIPVSDGVIRQAIKEGNADSEFLAVRKYLAEYNKKELLDFKNRNVGSAEWVDHTIRSFERNGVPEYIPRQESVKIPNIFMRAAARLGFGTSEGNVMAQVSNLLKQSTEEAGGINSPVGPLNSTYMYSQQLREHTNRSVRQMNWLKEVLDMDFDSTGRAVFNKGVELTKDDLKLRAASQKKFFVKFPEYIGRISPNDPMNQFGRMNLEFGGAIPDNPAALSLRNKMINDYRTQLISDDPGVAQGAMAQIGMLKDALVVQHKGNFHLFQMTPSLKSAFDMDHHLLDGLDVFNKASTKLMTVGTTGRLSGFAPHSFIYNASMGSINAALRSKGGFFKSSSDAIQVWIDGVKGASDILVTGLADDFAQLLTHTLKTETGIGSSLDPKMLMSLQKKLAARAKNTMIHDVNSKTGSIGNSSVNVTPTQANITESMSGAVMNIHKGYGLNVLPEFVRIWDHLNGALHEGVAWGATLRRLGNNTKNKKPNEIRIAQREVADLVGNNTLQGASGLAKRLNAAIPYYSPMIQGLSTLGRAMHSAGTSKTLMKLSVLVGTPVATEILYNTFLEPGVKYKDSTGREWTHGEWYHKGWIPEQRTNNVIIQIPGQNPWEPLVIPMVPELATIKGLYHDILELTFGAANVPGITQEGMFTADHLSVGFGRAANIPYPPWIAAAIAGLGVDSRAGLAIEPGDGTSIVQSNPLPRPNRNTPNMAQARYEGGEMSEVFKRVIQAATGTIGGMGLKIYEELFAGDETTPLSERLTAVKDTALSSLASSSRMVGALGGEQVMHSASDRSIVSQVHNKKNALIQWQTTNKDLVGAGGMSGTLPKQGRTGQQTLDPITQDLAASTAGYQAEVASYYTDISNDTKQINSLAHSLVATEGGFGVPKGKISVAQRTQLLNGYKARINQTYKAILVLYRDQEEEFAYSIGKKLGRDLSGFTFDGWKDRPNPD
tara:strand:- start:131 stop:4534 length:4404 start_codon:yes stop_codon:yes gene_type:complete